MALQEAEQVSGEDFSGDWGERHDEELTGEQARQTSGEDFSGDWGERHDEELTGSEPAQQTSGEDYSGDWGERHDEELTAQQTSGEPDAVPQAVPIRNCRWMPRDIRWNKHRNDLPKPGTTGNSFWF